jgi:hypothetical protein
VSMRTSTLLSLRTWADRRSLHRNHDAANRPPNR